jgi:hypothetical protein
MDGADLPLCVAGGHYGVVGMPDAAQAGLLAAMTQGQGVTLHVLAPESASPAQHLALDAAFAACDATVVYRYANTAPESADARLRGLVVVDGKAPTEAAFEGLLSTALKRLERARVLLSDSPEFVLVLSSRSSGQALDETLALRLAQSLGCPGKVLYCDAAARSAEGHVRALLQWLLAAPVQRLVVSDAN